MKTDKIKETKNLDKTRQASLINRFSQSILKMILLTFGFSCTTSCGGLYGTPYADFEMKGNVTNEKGESLSDVEINSVSIESDSIRYERTVAITNTRGMYTIAEDLYSLQWSDGGYPFRFIGDTTLYEPFDTTIRRDQLHFKGADDWYEGKASIVVNVTLKEKEKNK